MPSVFIHDEVNEVLGRTPSWFVRWGNTLLLVIVAMLLGLSCIVYYPDIITGKAAIIPSANRLISSPTHETTVRSVHVKEGAEIKKGDIICLLTSVSEPRNTDTITAITGGIVHFQRLMQTSASISPASALVVIEGKAQGHRVIIEAPAFKAGKIRLGQKVRISPSKYPRQEFGELEGQIISKPAQEEGGLVKVEAVLLNNGLTTYGNKLELDVLSSGMATISVDRRTIFSKLFPFLK